MGSTFNFVEWMGSISDVRNCGCETNAFGTFVDPRGFPGRVGEVYVNPVDGITGVRNCGLDSKKFAAVNEAVAWATGCSTEQAATLLGGGSVPA